jgi:hypothetical protein
MARRPGRWRGRARPSPAARPCRPGRGDQQRHLERAQHVVAVDLARREVRADPSRHGHARAQQRLDVVGRERLRRKGPHQAAHAPDAGRQVVRGGVREMVEEAWAERSPRSSLSASGRPAFTSRTSSASSARRTGWRRRPSRGGERRCAPDTPSSRPDRTRQAEQRRLASLPVGRAGPRPPGGSARPGGGAARRAAGLRGWSPAGPSGPSSASR